jgi:hypothetical protein
MLQFNYDLFQSQLYFFLYQIHVNYLLIFTRSGFECCYLLYPIGVFPLFS